MSQEVMEAILNIAYLYAPPGRIFIRVFGGEKTLHVIPKYATDKLVMQEVSYHLSTWLSTGLHKKKKGPWPILPLLIKLYEIKNLKDVDVEAKEILKFKFKTKYFILYDPHNICKNHYARLYYPWIHETFH